MSNLPKTIKKEQIFKSHFKYCLNKWFPDTIFLTQLSSFPNCTDVYHQICGHSTTTCDQILPVFDCQPRSRRQLWTSYLLPQCYRKWHFKAPLCITFKIKIWVVAYFFNFSQLFQQQKFFFIKSVLCNFSMRLLKCFFKFFFALKKLKKPPSKVAQNSSNPLFSLTASTAQMAQTEEFMFQNVANCM